MTITVFSLVDAKKCHRVLNHLSAEKASKLPWMTTINGKPTKLRGVAVDTVECGDGCLRFAKKSSIRKQSKKRGQVGEARHVQNLSDERSRSTVSASVHD